MPRRESEDLPALRVLAYRQYLYFVYIYIYMHTYIHTYIYIMTRREAEDLPASSVLAYSARARESAAAKKARLTWGGVTLRCMPTTAFTATDRCLAV
jgi:hypothetical protein